MALQAACSLVAKAESIISKMLVTLAGGLPLKIIRIVLPMDWYSHSQTAFACGLYIVVGTSCIPACLKMYWKSMPMKLAPCP
jgi:hypothetical protein